MAQVLGSLVYICGSVHNTADTKKQHIGKTKQQYKMLNIISAHVIYTKGTT